MEQNIKNNKSGEQTTNAPVPGGVVTIDKDEVVVPQEEETVKIPKSAFDELMSRMAHLESQQELMLAVEDKNKLRRIEEMRNKGKLVKSVKLNVVDGKIVTSYKLVQDEVYLSTEGKLIENQVLKLSFDDGSSREIQLRQWPAFTTFIECEVVGQNIDKDGEITYTVQTPDGKDVDINIRYVN